MVSINAPINRGGAAWHPLWSHSTSPRGTPMDPFPTRMRFFEALQPKNWSHTSSARGQRCMTSLTSPGNLKQSSRRVRARGVSRVLKLFVTGVKRRLDHPGGSPPPDRCSREAASRTEELVEPRPRASPREDGQEQRMGRAIHCHAPSPTTTKVYCHPEQVERTPHIQQKGEGALLADMPGSKRTVTPGEEKSP